MSLLIWALIGAVGLLVVAFLFVFAYYAFLFAKYPEEMERLLDKEGFR